jgi:hypothetical protein
MSVGFSAALVGIVLAATLHGQPVPIGTQEEQRALELLNSRRWVEKAWGTFMAGRLHSRDLHEHLIREFRDAAALRNAAPSSEEHAFVDALFDAAIVSQIAVPSALLEPFAENWATPVLILLARAGDSEGVLLALRGDKSSDMVWLTANNLLCEMKSQRWYSAIWEEISVTHRFVVVDSEGHSGLGGGMASGTCGDGVAQMPRDYPPVGLYVLEDRGGRQRVVVAEGPRTAYYSRTIVPTNSQVGIGACTPQLDRAATRIGYLEQLRLEPADETEQHVRAETQIVYTSNTALVRDIEQRMAEQAEYIAALLRSGEREGLRPPHVPLRIVPEIVDKRKNARVPLPVVNSRNIDLR